MNIIFLDFDGVVLPLRNNVNTRSREWKSLLKGFGIEDMTG